MSGIKPSKNDPGQADRRQARTWRAGSSFTTHRNMAKALAKIGEWPQRRNAKEAADHCFVSDDTGLMKGRTTRPFAAAAWVRERAVRCRPGRSGSVPDAGLVAASSR